MTDLITLPRATVQQALEALENGSPDQYPEDAGVFYDAKDALRAALEQPEQEPLSDEELDRLWREPMSADWEHREYARAVEAAHGIKEQEP
jgi:hypothetical protein